MSSAAQGLVDLFAQDSLFVYDWQLSRGSIFDTAGRFVRTVALRPAAEGSVLRVVGLAGDGSLLATTGVMFTPGAEPGAARDTLTILRYSLNGQALGTFGIFPDNERYVKSDARSVAVTNLAFGRQSHWAARDGLVFFGDSERYEVRVYTPEGTLQRLIRAPQSERRVSPEDMERYRQAQLQGTDEQARPFMERLLQELPHRATMPQFGDLVVDLLGNVWVEEFRAPHEREHRWTVFDPRGRMLGTVVTPQGLEVYEIGSDFILGRWRDELDVEHVQLYGLER